MDEKTKTALRDLADALMVSSTEKSVVVASTNLKKALEENEPSPTRKGSSFKG